MSLSCEKPGSSAKVEQQCSPYISSWLLSAVVIHRRSGEKIGPTNLEAPALQVRKTWKVLTAKDAQGTYHASYFLTQASRGSKYNKKSSTRHRCDKLLRTMQHNTATIAAESYSECYGSSAITITDKAGRRRWRERNKSRGDPGAEDGRTRGGVKYAVHTRSSRRFTEL